MYQDYGHNGTKLIGIYFTNNSSLGAILAVLFCLHNNKVDSCVANVGVAFIIIDIKFIKLQCHSNYHKAYFIRLT